MFLVFYGENLCIFEGIPKLSGEEPCYSALPSLLLHLHSPFVARVIVCMLLCPLLLQLHCLRCLRFLYSVEKNRKAFKVVFPAEIYGTFIDVGNYNKEFQAYIPLLKKFNKKLPVEKLVQIRENLECMGKFIKLSAAAAGDKFVNGFKVLDLIGKGAYGSVYLV